MPVRSLHSSVKKWPGRTEVFEAFRAWAYNQMKHRSDIGRIGCFGSLVNGTWGVGSDIDIIIILSKSDMPSFRRSIEWDTTSLPVSADIVVLTEQESKNPTSPRFRRVLEQEVVWVASR
jgi:predicted nucleotidyltransferase